MITRCSPGVGRRVYCRFVPGRSLLNLRHVTFTRIHHQRMCHNQSSPTQGKKSGKPPESIGSNETKNPHSIPPDTLHWFVREFNMVSATHRWGMFFSYFGIRLASFFSIANVLQIFGVAGSEFALAWMITRTTFKFRQPLNIALAVAASKALPALGALNITPLVIPPANNFPPPHPKMKFRIRGSYIEELSDFLGKKVGGGVKKVNSFVEGPVEKYGTAFFLSQKVTNLATLLGCAWMVKYGVDLEGFLVNYGMLKEIGDSFGRMACSFMINFALTPAHLTGALVLAPFTEKIRVRLYGNARIKRERFTKMYYEENR